MNVNCIYCEVWMNLCAAHGEGQYCVAFLPVGMRIYISDLN